MKSQAFQSSSDVTCEDKKHICIQEFAHLCQKYKIEGWSLKFSIEHDIGSSFGLCVYTHKQIQINPITLKTETVDDLIGTVRHEVAHILAPYDGHGKVWKHWARILGCSDQARRVMSHESHQAMIDSGTMKKVKWVMHFEGQICKRYYRTPNLSVFEDLPSLYLRSNKEATFGKLKLSRIEDFNKMYGSET